MTFTVVIEGIAGRGCLGGLDEIGCPDELVVGTVLK